MRLEPRVPDTDVQLAEWHEALQQLQGRVTYVRNREAVVCGSNGSGIGGSSSGSLAAATAGASRDSPGRGWLSTRPHASSRATGAPPGGFDDSSDSSDRMIDIYIAAVVVYVIMPHSLM